MNILFATLGHAAAVVPEAYLIGREFDAVWILTTAKTDTRLIRNFFARFAPDVTVEIFRVVDFDTLQRPDEHFIFEEVLYRLILHSRIPSSERFFCISGGYKTMSSAMQRAASLFGAAEVFHVLAAPAFPKPEGGFREPATVDEIIEAKERRQLSYIALGPEAGWPHLAQLEPDDFPLSKKAANEPGEWFVRAPDFRLREYIQSLQERSKNVYQRLDFIAELPFPGMAAWPQPALDWLNEPVDPQKDISWIAGLPKVELHTHLGGFATTGELLEQVRHAAEKPASLPPLHEIEIPDGWPCPYEPVLLKDYLRLGDNNGSRLLRDPGCLRKQCELLYRHLQEQKVIYAEVRCSPGNYATDERSPWTVLSDIRNTFSSCMRQAKERGEFICHVNLIIIATRRELGNERSAIARHFALAVVASEQWREDADCRVVGVDLAGYEDPTTRAHYYREEFVSIHRAGLAVTVHAGENDDVEAIWRAVLDVHARRLGHALRLLDSKELMRSVADRRIGVELCPYANMQIGGYKPYDSLEGAVGGNHYPLWEYLRQGIPATINTDNIGISSANLTENYLLAARLCPQLTRRDLLQCLRNAIDVSFAPMGLRNRLLRQVSKELSFK